MMDAKSGNHVQVSVTVIPARKPVATPPPTQTNSGPGGCGSVAEAFDCDLRDALAGTIVRDASFSEFRQVLDQFLGHLRH